MAKNYQIYISAGANADIYSSRQTPDTDNAFNNQPSVLKLIKSLPFPNNSVGAARNWLLENYFKGATTQPPLSNPQVFQFFTDKGYLYHDGGQVAITGQLADLVINETFSFPSWAESARKKPILGIVRLNDLSENRKPTYLSKPARATG